MTIDRTNADHQQPGTTQPWQQEDADQIIGLAPTGGYDNTSMSATLADLMAHGMWRRRFEDLQSQAAERERLARSEGFEAGRAADSADLQPNFLTMLRADPADGGGPYLVRMFHLDIYLLPSRDSTGYGLADPPTEIAVWAALRACVRRAIDRNPLADGVAAFPNIDPDFPVQILCATWVNDEGDKVRLGGHHSTGAWRGSRKARVLGRRPAGLLLLLPTAAHRIGGWALTACTSTAGAVAIAATGTVIVAAGVTPGIGAPATAPPQPSEVTIRYAAPALPLVDPADSPTPSPHPHHTPTTPPATPTAYPGRTPPAVRPISGPTITPSVPATVTPTALRTVLTLASP